MRSSSCHQCQHARLSKQPLSTHWHRYSGKAYGGAAALANSSLPNARVVVKAASKSQNCFDSNNINDSSRAVTTSRRRPGSSNKTAFKRNINVEPRHASASGGDSVTAPGKHQRKHDQSSKLPASQAHGSSSRSRPRSTDFALKYEANQQQSLKRSRSNNGSTRQKANKHLKEEAAITREENARSGSQLHTAVIQPSSRGHPAGPDSLQCRHYEQCSGCNMGHNLRTPPQYLEAQDFFRSLGVSHVDMVSGPLTGWRRRAKLAVRGRAGKPVIGLFKQGSHDAVSIPECVTHHPSINAAVAVVEKVASQLKIEPYNEYKKAGLLRYLQLTVVTPSLQFPEGQQPLPEHYNPIPVSSQQLYQSSPDLTAGRLPPVQLVLVVNTDGPDSPSYPAAALLADKLWAAAGSAHTQGIFHSIWVNFQPAANNAVLGRQWLLLHGPRHVWEAWGGVPVCIAPGSFVQANYGAFSKAVSAMRAALPQGTQHIVEMHAGVGAIGLSLVGSRDLTADDIMTASSVTPTRMSLRCVEINPEAEAPFHTTATALKLHWQRQQPQTTAAGQNTQLPELSYVVAAAGSRPAEFLEGADVVVVDPPRKGLEPSLLEALADLDWARGSNTSMAPRRLLYLSCGWQALKRDTAVLLGLAPVVDVPKSIQPHADMSIASSTVTLHAVDQPNLKTDGCESKQLPSDFNASVWKQIQPPRWRLVSATAFLFFPGTDSIETLAIFEELV